MTLSGIKNQGGVLQNGESLNPSFSGWPSLGTLSQITEMITKGVLIPLLVDDPLWALEKMLKTRKTKS